MDTPRVFFDQSLSPPYEMTRGVKTRTNSAEHLTKRTLVIQLYTTIERISFTYLDLWFSILKVYRKILSLVFLDTLSTQSDQTD